MSTTNVAAAGPGWVRRTRHVLRPDPARVVSFIFLPGQEVALQGGSRSHAVLERILALSDEEVEQTLTATAGRFGARHRDLEAEWEVHFELIAHRFAAPTEISRSRRLLVGAFFTQEYAIEGAAFFNPSMVLHPDQSGLPSGAARFVLSARAVGEGHISSVEWRTGVVDHTGEIHLDDPPTTAHLPDGRAAVHSRKHFEQLMRDDGSYGTNAAFVLAELGEQFSRDDLGPALEHLHEQSLTRGEARGTIARLQHLAACNYTVEFAAESVLQERVLMPHGPSETRGMEDVRLVRFTGDDGAVDYFGTYTAYDGHAVSCQMLHTKDFRRFDITQLSGPGARNKGMALFPRRVGGRYLALSRADRENNLLTSSTDLHHWVEPTVVAPPRQPWEIIQVGNCGPPIETDHGWVVLTHGVGPMREYAMGAILLDLHHPTIVRGRLRRPLLTPNPQERSGYVPNVVYSCGALRHGDHLVIPYGCSDSSIRIAVVDLPALLDELTRGDHDGGTP
jgi:predicted GH43/DUF377 family glycosyl hydrolase